MHSTDNLNDKYLGSGKRLRNSIRYHGKENHKIEILEFLTNRSKLKKRESEIVNEKFLENSFCMNLTVGGRGEWIFNGNHTEEAKQKISKGLKGIRRSTETIKKMSEAKKKWHQENPNFNKGENHPLFGKKMSSESRDKMSESATGNKHSIKTKEKISKGLEGRFTSEETKKKISDSNKGKNKGKAPWNKGIKNKI